MLHFSEWNLAGSCPHTNGLLKFWKLNKNMEYDML